MSSTNSIGEHFVYLYRDQAGRPIYVGRGGDVERSLGIHNEDLNKALAKNSTINIAGPFGRQDIATAVEAALISAIADTPSFQKHLKNMVQGTSIGVFRPLGVPPNLADRISLAPLTAGGLKRASEGRPVLLVYISSKQLGDREGVDLANLPSDEAIQNRMVRWWQLHNRMKSWQATPELIPAILLGVSGTPKHRIVIGSLQIDAAVQKLPWIQSKVKPSLSEVPVHSHRELDFAQLRGRRFESDLVIFGGITPLFFKII